MYDEINKTTKECLEKKYVVIEKETLEELLSHYDKKQDSRTDYITNQLSWNNLWLFIIAIYFIIKIIGSIIALSIYGELIIELLNALLKLSA